MKEKKMRRHRGGREMCRLLGRKGRKLPVKGRKERAAAVAAG